MKDNLPVEEAPKFTYADFIKKWANKFLYETPHDIRSRSIGKIELYEKMTYRLSHYPNHKVIADVILTPTLSGWKDKSQRREFYKDANAAGLTNNKETKCEWYKIIDLIEIKPSAMKHFKLEFKAGRDWEGDWTSFWGLHTLLGYTWSEWNQTIGSDLRKVWVDGVEIDKFKWHHY